MRIQSVRVENVGGVVNQTINFPPDPVVALAGPNGTGKSKMLAAILSYWTNHVPTPPTNRDAIAEVTVHLTDSDRQALADFSASMGWNEYHTGGGGVVVPQSVTLTTTANQLAGTRRTANPSGSALTEFANQVAFLSSQRSLDVMYLPAERRLMPSGGGGIDFGQLADEVAFQKTADARSAIQNHGRLDDAEFESFAKALCMDDFLDDPPGTIMARPPSRVSWSEFVATVNDLIYPKTLLPLYRGASERLLIQLPGGATHGVPELSSGERQALVIISRVLRAGAGRTVVVIDEPDAYLHPNLSRRLMRVLQTGVGPDGQLIIATHSPAILDQLPPSCIIRLDHTAPAQVLNDDHGVIALHRDTGFRASAVTQSGLLVVTEGALDEAVLQGLFPELTTAAISQGHGRAGVLARVRSLHDYTVPVIGLVDHDVQPPTLPSEIRASVCVLPTADIEGAFFSADSALEVMLRENYVLPTITSVEGLRVVRDGLYAGQRDSVIAEIGKNTLRKQFNITWPNSRTPNPLDVLRSATEGMALRHDKVRGRPNSAPARSRAYARSPVGSGGPCGGR